MSALEGLGFRGSGFRVQGLFVCFGCCMQDSLKQGFWSQCHKTDVFSAHAKQDSSEGYRHTGFAVERQLHDTCERHTACAVSKSSEDRH